MTKEIYTPSERIRDGFIIVQNGTVKEIGTGHEPRNADFEMVDFSDLIVAPGLIDIHIHGIRDGFSMDTKPESIARMQSALASHGVTAFAPTTEAAPLDLLKKALRNIHLAMARPPAGAKVIGANLEGPFLSPEKPGAMKPDYIRSPNISEFNELFEASGGSAKLVTIAPEIDQAVNLIEHMARMEVTVSMGHTNATYREANIAIKAGVTHVTHLFNAMRSFHHREPGVIGAALESPDVSIELIGDLVHVHPSAIKLIHRSKPLSKIVIVSDSVLADSPTGVHDMWGQEVLVKDDVAVLPDGTIAGSVLTLDEALRRLVSKARLPLGDVLTMMTINPAKVVKVDNFIGSIEKAKSADLIALDDDLKVVKVLVNGRILR